MLSLHKDMDTHEHLHTFIHAIRKRLHWGGMKRQPKPLTQKHSAAVERSACPLFLQNTNGQEDNHNVTLIYRLAFTPLG